MWPLIALGAFVLMGSKPATAAAPPQSSPPQTPPQQSTGQIIVDTVAIGVSLVEMFKKLMDSK